ncbi:efflux transporter outer membrane subunit [Methylobacillus gramineus]|uniref:efflux transporter outer membrane subunit n=1 Tax=Methylobacillus gramineus TaxID=755169 RepID=UPI001CFFB02E|nr:efflux transporter outer membrane subunit [Methylobacillus gramineus]MCB5186302.1 efflux transporter outer membrane subunit [Methylobacillus gramineus]
MSYLLKPSLLVMSMALAACSLNPDYARPNAPIPASYPVTTEAEAATAPNSWQQYFTEPELQRVIAVALENNRDLRITALRIEEARAQYGIQRADRLPAVNGTLSYERSKTIFAQGQTFEADMYRVGLGISDFELDFFGRVKSLSTAALEEYFATEEAKQTARTSLIAEVAVAYLNVRTLTERQAIAQDTLASREVSLARIQRRFNAGIDTAIDLKTAEVQQEATRASLAALRREQLQAVNALVLLVGDQNLHIASDEPLDTLNFAALPIGLPSELIERRPDIRAAEHKLLAANANIGAARAAFFPRVQLTTNIGLVNEHFSKLFSGSSSRAWAFTPQLTLPIFNHGRNQANLDLVSVRKNISVAEYEKTIQIAFSEVSDVLLARTQLEEEIAAQSKVTAGERERLRLATRRYDMGISSYLELLDAQRSLFDSEQMLVQLKQLSLSNSINLFKVLGGEWKV